MKQKKTNRRAFLTAIGAAGTACLSNTVLADDKNTENTDKKTEFFDNIPIGDTFDVVVCGGGPAGLAAALAARQAGLRVLIVEGQGQLGGMATSGLVSHWLGGRSKDCKRWIVGGIFKKLAQQATQQGVALLPELPADGRLSPHGWGILTSGVPLDPFGLAAFLDDQFIAAGIEMLFHTQAINVKVEQNRITHVLISNKSGLSLIPTAAVIDATGDADIAARSGCDYVKGQPPEGLMTQATLMFHVDNVDQDQLAAYMEKSKAATQSNSFRQEIAKLREAGEWPLSTPIITSVQLTEKGTMMINSSRLTGIDGTDGKSVTDGMIRGRRETQQLLALMRKHFAGFQNARIKTVATLLGVRETRRIVGDFIYAVSDIVSGQTFEDTIGYSGYWWDLTDPKKVGFQPVRDVKIPGEAIPIPYRIMIPRPIVNLICPGRAVSVERDVLGPLRVSAPCFAMGQAAGQAARQVVQGNISFAKVDTAVLRKELAQQGTIIEWPA
jgi:hypothetical protein